MADNPILCFYDFDALPLKVKKIIFEYLREIRNVDILEYLDSMVDECRSPIELIFCSEYFYQQKRGMPIKSKLIPQYEVNVGDRHFVSDFCIEGTKVLIECDGYEYHHKDISKVNYDTERDNILKADGYEIIHFTGSQIYRDSIECLKQLVRYINMLKEKGIIDGNI